MNTVTVIDRIPGNKVCLWAMALRFGLLHKDRSLGLWTESLGRQPFYDKTVLVVDEFTKSAAEMVAAFAAKRRKEPHKSLEQKRLAICPELRISSCRATIACAFR